MKYKIMGIILGISLLSSPFISEACDVFNDVKEDSWYYNSVKELKERGIVNGFDGGDFKPNEKISREEAAAMAYRLFTSDLYNISIEKPSNIYEDIDENSWAIEYIEYLTQNGILSGYGENLFFPDKLISREETAVIFDRIIKKKGLFTTIDEDLFKDDEEISPWSRDSVYRLKSSNYIKGYENQEFKPKESLTRAEMAQIIYNILPDLRKGENNPEEINTDQLIKNADIIVSGQLKEVSEPFEIKSSESDEKKQFRDVKLIVYRNYKGKSNNEINIRIPESEYSNDELDNSSEKINIKRLEKSILFLFKPDEKDPFTTEEEYYLLKGNQSIKDITKELKQKLGVKG